ncbi:MAG: hypothetical protein ACOYD4_07910 [Solirubrobacterales bacterium]
MPFPREGEAARLYAHLNDPPPAPSLYVPALPMALDDVVVRAMSKQPGDRFPSAGDLGRAAPGRAQRQLRRDPRAHGGYRRGGDRRVGASAAGRADRRDRARCSN